MTVRVLLADDQPLIRSGLRILISDTADMAVVGEAATGAQAVALAAATHPDVVVLDIRMPELDGILAAEQILANCGPSCRVLMLTTFDEDENVYAALRAGASGFLVKDMALDEILAAIRVVAAGDALLAPAITRRVIAGFVDRAGPAPVRPALGITEREQQVLTLIGRGRSNGEIAAELYISVATAKAHVARLLTKLDARDRVQLVIVAYEHGLVPSNAR
jgi:DNA-binding NarL/FixJ family response regulator